MACDTVNIKTEPTYDQELFVCVKPTKLFSVFSDKIRGGYDKT